MMHAVVAKGGTENTVCEWAEGVKSNYVLTAVQVASRLHTTTAHHISIAMNGHRSYVSWRSLLSSGRRSYPWSRAPPRSGGEGLP